MRTENYYVDSINTETESAVIICNHGNGYITRCRVNCLTADELAALDSMTSNDLREFIDSCGSATADAGLTPDPQVVNQLRIALNCELNDKTYNTLTDEYSGDIDRLVNDIDHDYLTANDYQGATYLHYLSDYGEWLINIANGELITDPEDINSIVL